MPGPAPATRGHLVTTRGARATKIDIWLTRGDKTVRDYDVDMTKRIHLIAIGPGLRTFAHLHPELAPDGHFRMALAMIGGAYELYADTVPHGDPQTVFRFAVPLAQGATPAERGLLATPAPGVRSAQAGPYVVTVDTTTLKAGIESPIHVRVSENGKPATDLESYLGASAHVVLIETRSLAYVHVHPELSGAKHEAAMPGMPGMSMGEMPELAPGAHVAPAMTLRVRVAAAGTYRMWLQFASGNGLWVAPFSLTAR